MQDNINVECMSTIDKYKEPEDIDTILKPVGKVCSYKNKKFTVVSLFNVPGSVAV